MRAVTTCPFDGETITIKVVASLTDGFLKVEDLLAAVRKATAKPVTQEDFTIRVHRAIKWPITTTGVHSGVTIKCSCS